MQLPRTGRDIELRGGRELHAAEVAWQAACLGRHTARLTLLRRLSCERLSLFIHKGVALPLTVLVGHMLLAISVGGLERARVEQAGRADD